MHALRKPFQSGSVYHLLIWRFVLDKAHFVPVHAHGIYRDLVEKRKFYVSAVKFAVHDVLFTAVDYVFAFRYSRIACVGVNQFCDFIHHEYGMGSGRGVRKRHFELYRRAHVKLLHIRFGYNRGTSRHAARGREFSA